MKEVLLVSRGSGIYKQIGAVEMLDLTLKGIGDAFMSHGAFYIL